MKISLKAIIPNPAPLKRITRAVIGAGLDAAAAVVVRDYEAQVRGWKHRPAFRVTRDGDDRRSVTTDDPVFIYQDRGTGTHAGRGRYLILPRRKKALKFKNGAIRKRALHPGVPAQKFTERVQGKAASRVLDALNGVLERVTP